MAQKLFDKVRDTARLKHLSIRTEKAYLQWIHPVEMCENEIRSFLIYLSCDKYVSSSTQNQALNAIILGIRFAIVGSTAPAKKYFIHKTIN